MAYSSFPKFAEPQYTPNDSTRYRTTSPLVEGPFKRSGKEIKELFFGSAESHYINGADIIFENDVSVGLIQELYEFQQSDMSGLYRPEEPIEQVYEIKVFVSKDATYLQQAFEKTAPRANEICLFLEDNSTDYFSGGTAFAKIGKDFSDDLKSRKEIAENEAGKVQDFQFINENNETDLQIDFTESEIEELIATGEITNASRELMIGVLQIANLGNILLSPLYRILGDGILWITGKLREYIKFQDYHWDPEAKKSKGDRFEPVLCPVANEVMDMQEWIGKTIANEIAETLKEELNKWKNGISSLWATYSRFRGSATIPQSIFDFLSQCERKIIQLIDQSAQRTKTMVDFFVKLNEKFINAVNAFYCGLWNSLVEIVLGLIDLVGYLFTALAIAGEAVANAQTLIPTALELVDELLQAVFQTDFIDLSWTALTTIMTELLNVDFMTLVCAISVERTAYFLGACIGFIIDIVAGILYSGGLKSLEAILAKFGKVGSAVLELVSGGTKKMFKEAVSFSLDTMVAIVTKFVELLKKGKEEVVSFIKSVFAAIKEGAKITDEIIAEIMQKFGFTVPEKQLMDEMGLVFIGYTGDACSICNKTM